MISSSIEALLELGAVDGDEKVAAIEAYARQVARAEGVEEFREARSGSGPPRPPLVNLGAHLADGSLLGDDLAQRLYRRADALLAAEPAVCRSMHRMLDAWPNRISTKAVVEDIAAGRAEADTIAMAIGERKRFVALAKESILNLLQKGGIAEGIAAVLLGELTAEEKVLTGGDGPARAALLAAARLARDRLPVAQVGDLLSSKEELQVQAAAAYLAAEDSPGARALLRGRLSGAVHGARSEHDPGHFSFPALDRLEEDLAGDLKKKERKAPVEPGVGGEQFFVCDPSTGATERVEGTFTPWESLKAHRS